MAIKKYRAVKDNTITNAYKPGLNTRATGSNMGAADALEVFTIYGQVTASAGGNEKSRILIKFNTDDINTDRTAGTIGDSGSVKWILNLTNAETPYSVPSNFDLQIYPIERGWDEGVGMDMDDYSDSDASNWDKATDTVNWTKAGGDFHEGHTASYNFPTGTENLEVDVSDIVEKWLDSTIINYGFLIRMTASIETGTVTYFDKKFYARTSQYELKRPALEARWDDSLDDNSANFVISSSLAPAADNLNTIYLYNYIRGELKNIPDVSTGEIFVSIYSGSSDDEPTGDAIGMPTGGGIETSGDTNVTGGWVGTGIYSATFAYTSSAIKYIYPVWHTGSTEYYTGSVVTASALKQQYSQLSTTYYLALSNLNSPYRKNEKTRLRLYIRPANWSPNIYNVASATPQTLTKELVYYQVKRTIDDYIVIHYGTGTGADAWSKLSYDLSGNYFDLDFTSFAADYQYEISFIIKESGQLREQPDTFVFRVE